MLEDNNKREKFLKSNQKLEQKWERESKFYRRIHIQPDFK